MSTYAFVYMYHTYEYINNFVIHVQRYCFSTVYLETQRVEKPLLTIQGEHKVFP